MVDIGKFTKGHGYLEEGILTLEKVDELSASEKRENLPDAFNSNLTIEKYIMYFSGLGLEDEVDLERTEIEFECGIKITSPTGGVIEVLPNASPFMLAINCSFLELNAFNHNYDLEMYRTENI
jgi:hypothetical protein